MQEIPARTALKVRWIALRMQETAKQQIAEIKRKIKQMIKLLNLTILRKHPDIDHGDRKGLSAVSDKV